MLVDNKYPKTRFIGSGSAAAALAFKSKESGAGRFHDFLLPPLTIQEFLYLPQRDYLVKASQTEYAGKLYAFYIAVDPKEINSQFFEYLNFGGYPEILFDDNIKADIYRFIKSDSIDKVLMRDLPSLYGIRDVQDLNRFFANLAYSSGKEFSLQKISQESGLDKGLLKRYLEYLEAAFLIKVINKIDLSARHFKRATSFKIYLTNPSLRTALFSPIEPDEEVGHIVETAIFAQWLHRGHQQLHYAKWKSGRKEG